MRQKDVLGSHQDITYKLMKVLKMIQRMSTWLKHFFFKNAALFVLIH